MSPAPPPMDRAPILPEAVLREHQVFQPYDTRFQAAARLLQALWRREQGFAIGEHVRPGGEVQELGSRLSRQDAEAGANFISEDIYRLARREAAYREYGALYDTERLYGNLLSSQALCFNLFGLLRQDLDLASRVVERLMPGVYRRVTGVLFEHSPGRNDPLFTGDNTAFDAFLLTETDDQLPGFVAVEVKYAESFEDTGSGTGPRHDELSETSGLYGDHHADALRKPPLQQLWREHLLAYATLTKRPFSSGHFVVVAPALNHQAQVAAERYQKHLLDGLEGSPVLFRPWGLETVIEAIEEGGCRDPADALRQRYLRFDRLDTYI